MSTTRLTEELIRRGFSCPPPKKKLEICDAELPGLYIEVRATNPREGTYYLRYKSAGKTSHERLGTTTDTTLAEARKRAKTLKAEIQLGVDPRGQVRAEKAVMTYQVFFIDHYMTYVTPRKRSAQRDLDVDQLTPQQSGSLKAVGTAE